jgi:flagellar biosynthesis protein FlhB
VAEENSTPEERTELPTERKTSKIRETGGMFFSTEVTHVLVLLVAWLTLSNLASSMLATMNQILGWSLLKVENKTPLRVDDIFQEFGYALKLIGPSLATLCLLVAATATLVTMYQTDWNIKKKKIDIKWNIINPINGIKKIVSYQGAFNTIKAILKLSLLIPVAYFSIKNGLKEYLTLPSTTVTSLFTILAKHLSNLFWSLMYVLIPLAIFDYYYGKYTWLKRNKMTKQEVKDERKAIEGDESTKRKIIAKGLARISQRISQSVPTADVIITNPTHFAVALKYDRNSMKAPKVVAKGKGWLALKIREIARQSGVPVVERKTLARALYKSVEVNSEIPYELFKAVAEVIAYIMKFKNNRVEQT